MNSERLLREFREIYGPKAGMRIYMTVMPGIISDFSKMLAAAAPGTEVREEYILEDKKAALKLKGFAVRNDVPEISASLCEL